MAHWGHTGVGWWAPTRASSHLATACVGCVKLLLEIVELLRVIGIIHICSTTMHDWRILETPGTTWASRSPWPGWQSKRLNTLCRRGCCWIIIIIGLTEVHRILTKPLYRVYYITSLLMVNNGVRDKLVNISSRIISYDRIEIHYFPSSCLVAIESQGPSSVVYPLVGGFISKILIL